MSLDLNKLANKLANKLDEALIKETTESLTKFLNDKRMENNKQQTAVEWLFAELKNHLDMPSHHANEILKQAKEMEKEQIINAWMDGMEGILHKIAAEQYYNETYGGNK